MPEYLAPGVYVEETSFRAKTIEGVSTSTAGFVGATRYGPIEGEPQLVTSFGEFERIYGSLAQMQFEDESQTPSHNYMAHAVRAFFENGGRRLYISRVYEPSQTVPQPRASATLGSPPAVTISARHPGLDGRMRVTFFLRSGRNAFVASQGSPLEGPELKGVNHHDTVLIQSAVLLPAGEGLFRADRIVDPQTGAASWQFRPEGGSGTTLTLANLDDPSTRVLVLLVNVETAHIGEDGVPEREMIWQDLVFEPTRRQSLSQVFAADLNSPSRQARIPIIFDAPNLDGPQIARALIAELLPGSSPPSLADEERLVVVLSDGGSDGNRPPADRYSGTPDPRTGLVAFEDIADISIVGAPGHTAAQLQENVSQAIANSVIGHCERMRYRIAVLDSRERQGLSEIQDFRARLDSSHAAIYYPWMTIMDPVTDREINIPPSGAVAGIFARNDIEKGVHKAPANEVVRQALTFEFLINQRQQEVLNPQHINVLRFFEGRGNRLWGARTISSDPEFKYVNIRRYLAFLERSIERGTQWAVFENNGPKLWANVRRTIETFLFTEFQSGHLFGLKPEEAFFVRCDLSTMTQNDIDNGRLICLIGVALLRPAEFVIFRIGQFTADRRN